MCSVASRGLAWRAMACRGVFCLWRGPSLIFVAGLPAPSHIKLRSARHLRSTTPIRPSRPVPRGDRKGTNGFNTNLVTAMFIIFDRRNFSVITPVKFMRLCLGCVVLSKAYRKPEAVDKSKTQRACKDSLRGSSVNIGTTRRRLAWPLCNDDTHRSRSVNKPRELAGYYHASSSPG